MMLWISTMQRWLAALVLVGTLSGCGGGGGGSNPPPNSGPNPPGTPTGDTIAPATGIAQPPEPGVRSTDSISFTPTSDETGVTFEGSLDNGPFASISVPWELTELTDGDHAVSIRARDAAGNVDASPFTFSWSVDTSAPTATITFPLAAAYSNADRITVRGTANDANGITSVNVNGVDATTFDEFRNWFAVIPATAGFTLIMVSTTDTLGHSDATAASRVLTAGPPLLNSIGGMDYDPAGARIIVSDPVANNLYAFRVQTRAAQLISGNGAMNARTISGAPGELVIDAANDRALVLDSSRGNLISINLATGARTSISEYDGDPAHAFSGTTGLALDAQNNRVFVASQHNSSIIQVDLATGTRTVVASSTVGTGEALNQPAALVYDNVTTPGTPRLLVSEHYSLEAAAQLLQINIATLERTTFEPSSVGNLPLGGVGAMRLDAPGRRVLALDRLHQRVIAIDLDTGDRTNISGTDVGSGDIIDHTAGMAFTSTRLFTGQTRGELLEIGLSNGARSAFIHSRVGTGDRMSNVLGIALEQTTGTPTSLLATELSSNRLTRIDLATGNRSAVSAASEGGGSSLQSPVDVVIDTRSSVSSPSALVLLGGSTKDVVSVDLSTGDRTWLAELDNLVRPWSFVLDAERNRVLVSDQDSPFGTSSALYAVDLSSGAVTEISGPTRGSGPELNEPGDLVLDPAENPTRAIIADRSHRALLSVDFATGDRDWITPSGQTDFLPGPLFHDSANGRIIGFDAALNGMVFSAPIGAGIKLALSGATNSSLGLGRGPTLGIVQGLDVDAVNRFAYIADVGSNAILAIDLYSGDRILISH